MSKSLDPDEAGHFVEAHLGPNCLQNLSADDTSGKELKGLQNMHLKMLSLIGLDKQNF